MGIRRVWQLFTRRIKPFDSPEVQEFYGELRSLRKEVKEDHERIASRIDAIVYEIRDKQ